MKKLVLMAAMLVGSIATAESLTIVPYGTWTWLPNCQIYTRSICTDVLSSSNENYQSCKIEYSGTGRCSYAKMYLRNIDSNGDMLPTADTYGPALITNRYSYVDFAKVKRGDTGWPTYVTKYYINSFVHSNSSGYDNTAFDKVQYQFDSAY